MAVPQAVISGADRFGINTNVELDASGSPVPSEEGEQINCSCDAISLYMGDVAAGTGKLFVTTRRVIWQSQPQDATPPTLLSFTYPQIVMHAISKDTSAFPRPCIYLQLDDGSEDMMAEGDEEEEQDVEGADQGISPELRLVPEVSSKVEEIFKALCDCAALNPDPDNEGEGDFYFDEAEVMAGLDDASRAAVMAQRMEGAMVLEPEQELDELIGEDPGRFDDEDGEEEEEGQGMATGTTANGH